VIVYFEELKQRGVCEVKFAANRHTRGVVQICDTFWPYVIPTRGGDTEKADNYINRIRSLLKTRSCVSIAFAPADERLAQALYADHIALEDIEHAFLLGCTRKYVSWLNGQISGPLPVSDTSDPSSTKLHRWIRLWTIGATSARALISMNGRGLRIARMVCNRTQRSTVQCRDSLLAQQDQGIDG
jgi:hypothetical protein